MQSVRGTKTLSELSQEYKVYPNTISSWRKQLLENLPEIFETKRGPKPKGVRRINRLTLSANMETTSRTRVVKKNLTLSVKKKRKIIEPENKLITIGKQCLLIDLSRSSYYYSQVGITANSIFNFNVFQELFQN